MQQFSMMYVSPVDYNSAHNSYNMACFVNNDNFCLSRYTQFPLEQILAQFSNNDNIDQIIKQTNCKNFRYNSCLAAILCLYEVSLLLRKFMLFYFKLTAIEAIHLNVLCVIMRGRHIMHTITK